MIFSKNRDIFISFFLICISFLFLYCLITLARTSHTSLNKNSDSRHFYFVPRIRGKAFSLSPFSIMLCMYTCTQLCPTLFWTHGLLPARPLSPWNFPGKNTGMGCYFLLQGIFLTQRSNPCLLQADSLSPCHLGSPKYNVSYRFFRFIPIKLRR